MVTFLYVLYTLVCMFLILVVLLQAGRGGMGTAFGGSSQTVFGGSGAGNFLTRLTVISAALFMLLSATLTYVSSSGEKQLERASEKVRMREEARSAATKKGAPSKAPPPAEQSSPDAPSAPSAPAPAAPAGPVEGEAAPSAAGAAVDEALKELDTHTGNAPAAPAPAAPAPAQP